MLSSLNLLFLWVCTSNAFHGAVFRRQNLARAASSLDTTNYLKRAYTFTNDTEKAATLALEFMNTENDKNFALMIAGKEKEFAVMKTEKEKEKEKEIEFVKMSTKAKLTESYYKSLLSTVSQR